MDNIILEYIDYVNNKATEEKTQRTTIEEKNSNLKDYDNNASERIFFEKGVQTVEKYGDIYANNDNNIISIKIIYNNENLINNNNYNKNISTLDIGFQTNNNYNDKADLVKEEEEEKEIKDYIIKNKDKNKNFIHQSKSEHVLNKKKEIIFNIFKERKKKFGRKKKNQVYWENIINFV